MENKMNLNLEQGNYLLDCVCKNGTWANFQMVNLEAKEKKIGLSKKEKKQLEQSKKDRRIATELYKIMDNPKNPQVDSLCAKHTADLIQVADRTKRDAFPKRGDN